MYQSPIEIIEKQMRTEFDDNIYQAVQMYEISVDKDELIKALQYDRDQYNKGYVDGLAKAKSEVEDYRRNVVVPIIEAVLEDKVEQIFEEIDLIHKKVFVDVAKMNLGDLEKTVLYEYFKLISSCTNTLKKKYTEGKDINAPTNMESEDTK